MDQRRFGAKPPGPIKLDPIVVSVSDVAGAAVAELAKGAISKAKAASAAAAKQSHSKELEPTSLCTPSFDKGSPTVTAVVATDMHGHSSARAPDLDVDAQLAQTFPVNGARITNNRRRRHSLPARMERSQEPTRISSSMPVQSLGSLARSRGKPPTGPSEPDSADTISKVILLNNSTCGLPSSGCLESTKGGDGDGESTACTMADPGVTDEAEEADYIQMSTRGSRRRGTVGDTVGNKITRRVLGMEMAEENVSPSTSPHRGSRHSARLGSLSETSNLARRARCTNEASAEASTARPEPLVTSLLRSSEKSARKPRVEAGETRQALREAVCSLNAERVRELISAGVSVNAPYPGRHDEPRYFTLLHWLCGLPGHIDGSAPPAALEITESLLRARANLNPRSSDGCTPLVRACMLKNLDCARLLVDSHADISPCDDQGFSPLRWAIVLSEPQCGTPPAASSAGKTRLCFDLEEGEDVAARPSKVPQGPATSSGDVSGRFVRLLLDSTLRKSSDVSDPASPVSPQTKGKRRLRFSTSVEVGGPGAENERGGAEENWCLGHSKRAEGPLGNAQSAAPPLLEAVRNGNHGAARVLLECGMPVQGLREAVKFGSLTVVQVLLAFKADPMAVDKTGESPMDVGLQLGDIGILDALREAAILRGAEGSDESTGDSKASRRKKQGNRRMSVMSSVNKRSNNMGSQGRRISLVDLQQLAEAKPSAWNRVMVHFGSCMEWAQDGINDSCAALKPSVDDLSRTCLQAWKSPTFQTIFFACLISALFLPDTWVLVDAQNDTLLDVMLSIIFAGFLVEIAVQVVGLKRSYVFTSFFYMDMVGACSLILDLSAFRQLGNDGVSENAVLMRAARAAKLGARAGRFTKLVKILRFLPGRSDDSRPAGTAKGITSVFVMRVSTRVSCLIIVMVIALPLFNLFTYPEQDWAMQMWTEQLAEASRRVANANLPREQLQEVISDFRDSFAAADYFPFTFVLLNSTGGSGGQREEVLWQTLGPLRPSNEMRVRRGDVVVYFDFGGPNRAEAAANFCITIFTIMVMLGFSHEISRSVSNIAIEPLEEILSKIRGIGSTIYSKVDCMQQQVGLTRKSGDGDAKVEDREDMAEETALLERVVQKLAVLSELTVKTAQPSDAEALQYLGETHAPRDTRPPTPSRTDDDTQQAHLEIMDNIEELVAKGEASGHNMCSWSFNPLPLDMAQNTATCAAILRCASGKVVNLDAGVVNAFVDEAAGGYLKGPRYHNWIHATDVTHTLFVLLHQCDKYNVLLSCFEEFALIVSAVCHDVGHLGVNNDFLVQTSHELAIRYNDTSPLENMHCARLFEIAKDPRTAIFAPLPQEHYKEVRSVCIEAILHTDNVHHLSMVKGLQMFGEVNSELLTASREVYHRSEVQGEEGMRWPPQELVDILWEGDSRRLFRNMLLHLSDISNPAKPFEICRAWALCVLEEFFAQGDLETQYGLPVSPLNCREKTNRPLSQVGFIEFFVAPLVFSSARLLAPLEGIVEQLLANTRHWMEEWASEHSPSEEDMQGVAGRLRRLEERSPVLPVPAPVPRHSRASHMLLSPGASQSGRAGVGGVMRPSCLSSLPSLPREGGRSQTGRRASSATHVSK